MQLKKCRYPTCNELIPIDQANPFCSKHGKNWHQRNFKYQKTNYKNYNKYKRDPVANKFYHSRAWRTLSADLRRQSIWTCQCCGRTYDGNSFLVVDHIIPLKVAPNLSSNSFVISSITGLISSSDMLFVLSLNIKL